MPIARFQMEDGRIARFDVPEGTTPEQAQTLMQAHFSGNTAQSIKASNPGEYDPTSPEYKAKNTATGTFYENAMAGVGKAAVDTGRGIKGLFTDNSKDVLESRARDAELMKTGGGLVGNIGGNIGMMVTPGLALKGLAGVAGLAGAGRAGMALNTAGNSLIAPTTIPGALGLGAVTGAIQPASSMGERGLNTLIGGAAGAGGQAAFRGLSRMVSPNTSPEVRTLLNEGVTPTPGQILGGGFKRAEEGLTSLPIVGDAIKGGQRRAVDEFSNAAINRALQPIGARLPRGLQGHDAVAYAGDTLSARYDALMPRLTTSMDGQMIGELNQLRNSIGSGSINPVQAQQFERILNNDVLIKYQGPNATVTGETLKQIESDLGQLSKTYRTSPDPDQRLLGNALREVQAIVRGNVQRANPNAAPELRALNEGWANLVRVEKAAASQGAAKEGGSFSPAQLGAAVKSSDSSVRKRAVGRNEALMQDLSSAGQQVLSPRLADSGTPYRSLLALLAGTGGSHLVAGPLGAAGALGAAAVAPIAYSGLGQRGLAALLAQRPQGAVPIGNALRDIAPYAAIPAVSSTETLR